MEVWGLYEWDGNYDFYEYGIIFFICTTIGWVWESIYMSILEKRPLNRGFLYGPCIPIYGAAACIIMIVGRPLVPNWTLVAIVGMLVATFLEEITGRCMERIFGVRYWTYEGYPGNIDGFICIPATLFWGVCAIIANRWLVIPFEYIFTHVNPEFLKKLLFFVMVIFVVDVTLSIKNALDFKEIIERFAKSKSILANLSLRLDKLIEKYDKDNKYQEESKKERHGIWISVSKTLGSVKAKMDFLTDILKERRLKNKTEDISEKDMLELQAIRDSYMKEEQMEGSYIKRFRIYITHLMITNPRAKLMKLGKTLKEVEFSLKFKLPGLKRRKDDD